MRYPGGKGKCFQHVINLLPPHSTYIETHLGGGAVLRHKKTARTNIGIDKDPVVIRSWRLRFPTLATYVEGDAIDFLASQTFSGDEVVYCDPPYLPSTRRQARVYTHDYTERDHLRLLEALRNIRCRIVVSGYSSELYDALLRDWSTRTFWAKAHDSLRLEKLWYNFQTPSHLHDVRYIGRNFRERQTIKRRLSRLQRRMSMLSPAERQSLLEWLEALEDRNADLSFSKK